MLTRKLSNPTVNGGGDAGAQQALSYLRDFSAQAAQHRIRKTETALNLLNRSASLISTTIQPQYFSPTLLEVSTFFVDLHAVLGALSVDSNALWSCVSLLQHCCRNEEAHRAIVEEYRFVPLLTYLLKRTQANDKVLHLLQELTYGIRIDWEEPYLIVLLEQLVNIIYNAEETEARAQTALSILINLCYKNFVVVFLFLRTVNISEFSRKIQNFGMLSTKLLILLSEDVHSPDEQELHLFLRFSFVSFVSCLKDWNVAQLQQSVDFLVNSNDELPKSGLHYAMLNYESYCEDIERVLDRLDARSNMDDSNDEVCRQQQLCIALLFRLIRHIFTLSAAPATSNSENVISLDAIVPRIFELLTNWFESDICGVEAVHLLETMVRLAKTNTITPNIARNPAIIVQLITISEKPETSSEHTAAILQLLLALLHQSKTEKLILSKISESYFDKIFAPLLAHKTELPSVDILSVKELEKPIFCLVLLINFAGIAKKAYFEKCCTLLRLPQIQHALARVILSGSERVCGAVFEISQFEHFPQAAVAKHIAKLNASSVYAPNAQQTHAQHWQNLNAIFKNHKSFVTKETEARLQALIEHISTAQQKNQINNIATSQMIELYNYKIDRLSCAESSAQQRLEDASNEVTQLKQRINLQNAEIQKYNSLNFELHINRESLQTLCNDLKQQKDNLKHNMSGLMEKLAEQSKALQVNEKRLTVKLSEMIVLQKEHSELQEKLSTKTEELDKLQASAKENITRIDKLKNSVIAFEADIKEKLHIIEDKERDLLKTQKALEEQKDSKKKCDDIIAALEKQLEEKNDEIRNYENELSETEELRKTILSLMESKKPKRK